MASASGSPGSLFSLAIFLFFCHGLSICDLCWNARVLLTSINWALVSGVESVLHSMVWLVSSTRQGCDCVQVGGFGSVILKVMHCKESMVTRRVQIAVLQQTDDLRIHLKHAPGCRRLSFAVKLQWPRGFTSLLHTVSIKGTISSMTHPSYTSNILTHQPLYFAIVPGSQAGDW